MATKNSAKQFLDLLKVRRTIHQTGKEKILPDEEVIDLIKNAIKHSPTFFNSQTGRFVTLLGKDHERYWSEIVPSVYKKLITDEETWKRTESRINMFSKATGTVLFYESQNAANEWKEKRPTVAKKVDEFALVSNGIAQGNVWSILSQAGYGASLQHMGDKVQEDLSKEYNIPKDWKLYAELVFGSPKQEPMEKTFIDDSERFFVYGNQ